MYRYPSPARRYGLRPQQQPAARTAPIRRIQSLPGQIYGRGSLVPGWEQVGGQQNEGTLPRVQQNLPSITHPKKRLGIPELKNRAIDRHRDAKASTLPLTQRNPCSQASVMVLSTLRKLRFDPPFPAAILSREGCRMRKKVGTPIRVPTTFFVSDDDRPENLPDPPLPG